MTCSAIKNDYTSTEEGPAENMKVMKAQHKSQRKHEKKKKRLRAEKRKGKGERPGTQVRQKHAETKKSDLCDAKRGDWRKARISATCRDQQKISTTIAMTKHQFIDDDCNEQIPFDRRRLQ